MSEQAEIRSLILAIGLAVAPLLRRRISPSHRAELVGSIEAINRTLRQVAAVASAAPAREADQAMARWVIETYSGLSGARAGLALLDDALKVCDGLGVEWPDIVGAVNRMSDHRHASPNEPRPSIEELLIRLERGARTIAANLVSARAA